MQNFYNLNAKKKDFINYIKNIVISYLIKSSLFWVFLSVFFYFYLYNPYVENNTKIELTSSFLLFMKSSGVVVLTVVFSGVIGALLSIPAIFLKILLIFKLIKREKRGQKPVILIFFTTYIPFFMLIIINISFLFLNLAVLPDLMKNYFSDKNIVYVISKKINNLIFFNNKIDYYNFGKIIGNKYSKESPFIFFLPEEILSNNNYFLNSKNNLQNTSKIIITNSFKTDLISSIFKIYPEGHYKLFSPIPFEAEADTVDQNILPLDKSQLIYMGIDAENLYDFYSMFHHVSKMNKFEVSLFDLFLNRFAFSQPHLFYLFKAGIAGKFYILWKWPYIYKSDNVLLKKYATDLIDSKNINYDKFSFYLTGLENNKKRKLITQYAKKNVLGTEFEKIIQREDRSLSLFIKGLLFSGVKNINLIPYVSQSNKVFVGDFYSSNKIEKNIFVPENLNLFSEDQINKSKIKEEKYKKCYLKVNDFQIDDKMENILKKINFNSDSLYLKKGFRFYLENNIPKFFICYFNHDIYSINRINNKYNPNDFNYGENFSSIFEVYSEKNQYLKNNIIKNKMISSKIKELFKNEFFKQFRIYKLDNLTLKMILLVNSTDKDLFLRNYGDDIINEMSNYSSTK